MGSQSWSWRPENRRFLLSFPQAYRSYPVASLHSHCSIAELFPLWVHMGWDKSRMLSPVVRRAGLQYGSIFLVLSLRPPALRTVTTDESHPQWLPCDLSYSESIHDNSVCRELQSNFVSKLPIPQLLKKQLTYNFYSTDLSGNKCFFSCWSATLMCKE